jgi:hypothetical protein
MASYPCGDEGDFLRASDRRHRHKPRDEKAAKRSFPRFGSSGVMHVPLGEQPDKAPGLINDNSYEAESVDFLASLDSEAESLVAAARSEVHAEAVRAFIANRRPRFGRR